MNELNNQKVLAVDCQATGTHTESDYLVEIGWVLISAAETSIERELWKQTEARLIRPPKGAAPPPRNVLKLTGIRREDLMEADSGKKIWAQFNQAVLAASDLYHQRPFPTIIHFCRYEEPYLRELYKNWGKKNETFPLDIICTHKIVQRLYPGLPRKGLRAVNGLFGYSLPEQRRCRSQVVATAQIWHHLVRELAQHYHLTSFPELKVWLAEPNESPFLKRGRKRVYPMDKRLREGLPDSPGIYRMYRSSGDILYVGKAKSLKKRVNSYFQSRGRHAEHILEMLSQAKDLTITQTATALEAAVKEADEIKRLSPPFNRALQKKEREITYVSDDLMSFRALQPDPQHLLGPLPSHKQIAPLGMLVHLLNRRTLRSYKPILRKILDLPPASLPDLQVFEQGVKAFRKEYNEKITYPLDLRGLKNLGTLFWKEKLAEMAIEQDTTEAPEESSEDLEMGAMTWTPEQVVKVLKSIIRQGIFLLRRAQWLLRLSDSTLLWADKDDTQSRHSLVLDRGAARFTSPLLSGDTIDVPKSHTSSLQERRHRFDLSTYDRLRVLTTEMRRLINDGRRVELWLHPGIQLNEEKLKKILLWV